jgi:hypothetical protein
MTLERIAYICTSDKCVPPMRMFIAPGDTAPRCPDGHGPMRKQLNLPYVVPDTSQPPGKSRTVGPPARSKPSRPKR